MVKTKRKELVTMGFFDLFKKKKKDKTVEYLYRVGWCSCCDQGGIFVLKDKKSDRIFAFCQECDTEWNDMENFDTKALPSRNWTKQEVKNCEGYEDATIEDIQKKGWVNSVDIYKNGIWVKYVDEAENPMIKLNIEKPCVTMIYLGYLPLEANAGMKTITESIESIGDDTFDNKRATLEYSSPMHNNSYGFLGFEYMSGTDEKKLEIVVNYIDDRPFNGAIFEERITYGIEEYYVKAIIEEAKKQFKARQIIPSGKFVFCKGQTGDVRSSPKRFQYLVQILINIFYEKERIDEQKLLNFKKLADEDMKVQGEKAYAEYLRNKNHE